MKMTEILEKDKDHLLTALTSAATAEKAVKVLENEMDKLLLKHNEQCSSEKEREAAAYMMQAVRLTLPLIDSDGKVKVWEAGSGNQEEEPRRNGAVSVLLTVLGIALCAFGLMPFVMTWLTNTTDPSRDQIIMRTASLAGGLIAVFLGGYLFNKPRSRRAAEHHVEIRIDPEKVYRNFRTAILSVDQSLEEVRSREKWEQREQAGNIDGRPATTPELELFSDLIAAAYSADPEYLMEKVDDIKYYLHKQQIEVVDYSEATKQFFDMMPGVQTGTIRPALIADGALLKKGMASTGK